MTVLKIITVMVMKINYSDKDNNNIGNKLITIVKASFTTTFAKTKIYFHRYRYNNRKSSVGGMMTKTRL